MQKSVNSIEKNIFQSFATEYESEENFQTQEIKRLKTLGFEKQNPIQVRVLTLNAYWTLRLVVIGQLLVNCIYFTWLGCVRFSDRWVVEQTNSSQKSCVTSCFSAAPNGLCLLPDSFGQQCIPLGTSTLPFALCVKYSRQEASTLT